MDDHAQKKWHFDHSEKHVPLSKCYDGKTDQDQYRRDAVCGKWSFKVWVKALCPIFCTRLAVSVAGERMLVIGPVFLYQA